MTPRREAVPASGVGRMLGRLRLTALTRDLFLSITALLTLVVLTVSGLWTFAQHREVRDRYEDRALTVAESVAAMPAVAEALTQDDPSEVLDPLAETLRTASDTEYVVVVDSEGIRQSHPDPSAVGGRPTLDPTPVLRGETWTGVEQGPAGLTLWARVPVTDPDSEEILGYVSVGILASQVTGASWAVVPLVLTSATIVLVLGAAGALLISRRIRGKTHGLEPAEIAALLDAREAMLHAIGEGIVAVDSHGRLSLANAAAQTLLALPADHLRRTPAELGLPADLRRALTDGRIGREEVVTHGRRVLICRRRPVRIRDEDGGSVVTVRDRTDVVTLSRQLDGAQTVTRGLRAQRHEFANRLHTVSGLLELGEVDEALDYLSDLSARTSRTDAAVRDHVAEPAVAALVLAKSAQADEAGCTVELSPLSSLPAGLPSDLRDDVILVIGNLVDNAMEAAGPGGRVELFVRHHSGLDGSGEEGALEIRVIDDGPGIDPALGESIFTAGVSTRGDGEGDLRGLGLALVRRTCERRDGTVLCETGAETAFSAFLPLSARAHQEER